MLSLFFPQSSGRVGGSGRLFPKELHLKRERRRGAGGVPGHSGERSLGTGGAGPSNTCLLPTEYSNNRGGPGDSSNSRPSADFTNSRHSSHHGMFGDPQAAAAGAAIGGPGGSQHQTAPRKVLLEQLSRMLPNENNPNSSNTPLPDQITVVNMCDRQVHKPFFLIK